MSSEIIISNISEYIQTICQKNTELKSYTYIRDNELLFRGQANKDYLLLPSIGRNRNYATQCTIFNEERNLIEMAKYKLPDVFRADLSPIELLALLQHHGIPTRLLDVTENALVALYFACCNNDDKDGEVIVFQKDNDDVTNYPVVNAIADSYRFAIRSSRQQAQSGRYIVFHNHINKSHEIYHEDYFEWKIDAIPKNHSDIILRFIIPKEIKKQLLIDLSILGIREDTLFCDNIDIVCKGIVSSFMKRYEK